jgi:uncharacterized protein (DUF1499 family)
VHPVINDVETGACRHHPDLQPQRFSASKTAVVAAVEAVARRQKRWRRLKLDLSTSTLTAVAVTKLVRFRDDVTIRVEEDGDDVVVNMRSASRLGKGDFGANARRIRTFQAALAAQLGGHS